ncbi:MAG: penicillin-binding protein, partial [Rhodoferax sp.]
DSLDAWFCGYQPTMTAIAWMGFDTPRTLGHGGTGASVSLPIWISFMQNALKGVPVAQTPAPPAGVVNVAGEWYYSEYANGAGVSSVGLQDSSQQNSAGAPPGTAGSAPAPSERQRILDMFKN